jgi:hypothetical protein
VTGLWIILITLKMDGPPERRGRSFKQTGVAQNEYNFFKKKKPRAAAEGRLPWTQQSYE